MNPLPGIDLHRNGKMVDISLNENLAEFFGGIPTSQEQLQILFD